MGETHAMSMQALFLLLHKLPLPPLLPPCIWHGWLKSAWVFEKMHIFATSTWAPFHLSSYSWYTNKPSDDYNNVTIEEDVVLLLKELYCVQLFNKKKLTKPFSWQNKWKVVHFMSSVLWEKHINIGSVLEFSRRQVALSQNTFFLFISKACPGACPFHPVLISAQPWHKNLP